MVSAILAISKNNCIGKDKCMPWPHIKEDMKWFESKTTSHIVVMGSGTWNSVGIKKPLKNRKNIVISSKQLKDFPDADDVINNNILENISNLNILWPDKEIFISGGSQIYKLCAPLVDTWLVTRIEEEYDGDTFLDLDTILQNYNFTDRYWPKEWNDKLPKYTWEIYKRK